MEELRYPCLACDPPSSAVIGTKEELETHLAGYHHTFYPHHCRSCGYRTYDKRAIYKRCVPLKHKVVFWEVREEEEEDQLAIELRACLRNPKPMVPLPTDASSNQLAETCAPSLLKASSPLPDGAQPQLLNEVMEIVVVKMAPAQAETTAVPATERVPPTARRKRCNKRASKLQVHTTMTCHFNGCGEKIIVRGKNELGGIKRRHVQKRHLSDEIAIRCPVHGCEYEHSNTDSLASHLRDSHGGVDALGADELASYRTLRKRVLNASSELLPICFPLGAVSRDDALVKKKSCCAKCGKSVEAQLDRFLAEQKNHVEKDHLSSCEIKCPASECTRKAATLKCLAGHIVNYHGGFASLNEKELATYRELRERINAARNKLFGLGLGLGGECFK